MRVLNIGGELVLHEYWIIMIWWPICFQIYFMSNLSSSMFRQGYLLHCIHSQSFSFSCVMKESLGFHLSSLTSILIISCHVSLHWSYEINIQENLSSNIPKMSFKLLFAPFGFKLGLELVELPWSMTRLNHFMSGCLSVWKHIYHFYEWQLNQISPRWGICMDTTS